MVKRAFPVPRPSGTKLLPLWKKARNASYADDAEKQAAVENAAAALEAAEDALYSAQKPPKMPTMRHFPPPKVPRITATPHCTRWRKSRKPRKTERTGPRCCCCNGL